MRKTHPQKLYKKPQNQNPNFNKIHRYNFYNNSPQAYTTNLIENLYKTIDKLTYRLMDKEKYISFLKDLLEENNIEFKKAFKENKWKYQNNNKKKIQEIVGKNFLLKRVNQKYFKISDHIENKQDKLEQVSKSEEERKEIKPSEQIEEIKDEDNNIEIINNNIASLIKQINNKIDSSILVNSKIDSSIPKRNKQEDNCQNMMGDDIVKEDLRIINNTMELNKGRNYNKNKKRRMKNKNRNNVKNKQIQSLVPIQHSNDNMENQFSKFMNNDLSANSYLHPRIINLEEFIKQQNMPGININQNTNLVDDIDTTSFNQQQFNQGFHGVNNKNIQPSNLIQTMEIQNKFETNQDVVTLNNMEYKEKGTNINKNSEIREEQQIMYNNLYNNNQTNITRAQQNKNKTKMEEIVKLNEQFYENWKRHEELKERMYHSSIEDERKQKEAMENYKKLIINLNNKENQINKDNNNNNKVEIENNNRNNNKNNNKIEENNNENKNKTHQNREENKNKIDDNNKLEAKFNDNNNKVEEDKNKTNENKNKIQEEINIEEEISNENKNKADNKISENKFLEQVDSQEENNNGKQNKIQMIKNNELRKNNQKEKDKQIDIQEENNNGKRNKIGMIKNNELSENNEEEEDKINENKNKVEEEEINKVQNGKVNKLQQVDNKNKNKNKIQDNKNKINQNKNKEKEEHDNEEELMKQIEEEQKSIQAENEKLESIYNLYIGKLVNSKTKLTSTQENEVLKFQKQVDKLTEREKQLEIKKFKINNQIHLRRVQNKLSNSLPNTQDSSLINKNSFSFLSPIKNFFLYFILFFLGLFKNNNDEMKQSSHIDKLQSYINNLQKQGANNGGGDNLDIENKNNEHDENNQTDNEKKDIKHNGNNQTTKVIVKKKNKNKNKRKNH